MKKLAILLTIIVGLFSSTPQSIAKEKPNIRAEDVLSLQIHSLSKEERLFSENDGFEARVLSKVAEWINEASVIKGNVNLSQKDSTLIKMKMRNGDVAEISPAYTCKFESQTMICTFADGEVVYSLNKVKVRLKSPELYDWLLVGWKHEADGPPKDELLEETLYTRYYFSHLQKEYADFFMCPKIDKVERINGDSRSHTVYASALSYSGHHDSYYDKINVILTDTRDGVQIKEIKKRKNLSDEESNEQCKRY